MALAQLYRVVQDLEGNVVTGVLGTVTLSDTSTLASLFADADGTISLPNPTTNNAQYGSFALFVGAGTYTMQFVKAGYTFEPQSNIVLRDPASGVTTITGTANRVIVSPVPGVGAVTLSAPQDLAPDSGVQFAHLGLGTPADGNLALSVSGNATFASGTLVASMAAVTHLGVGTPADAGLALSVSGNTTITGALTTSTLGVGGNASVYGHLGIATVADAALALSVNGNTTITGALVASTLAVSAEASLYGRVGIGKVASPTLALDVNGNMTITGTLVASVLEVALNVSAYSNLGVGAPAPTGPTAAGNVQMNGVVGIGLPPSAGIKVYLKYDKPTQYGLILSAQGSDAGNETVVFQNTSGAFVGSIQAGASATAYNTASDSRLKHAITALTGALDVVQALRPVTFRWNSTEELAHGFLAHELQQVVPDAVSGLPDAVNEDGSVKPQQVDHSRLVPWLTAALQETLAQVQALTARVVSLEAGGLA